MLKQKYYCEILLPKIHSNMKTDFLLFMKHKSVFIENYINIQQGQNHIHNIHIYNKKKIHT